MVSAFSWDKYPGFSRLTAGEGGVAHVCVTTVSNLTHVCATHAYITSTLRNLLYSAVSRKIKNAETVIVSAFCGVFYDTKVIRLGLANLMLCIDNQVVDIALPVVYTLRTRQCFNVLRHFSSDSANLIIFRDVHAILNVKVSAIGISTLAVIVLSNLNYFVSFEISMLV